MDYFFNAQHATMSCLGSIPPIRGSLSGTVCESAPRVGSSPAYQQEVAVTPCAHTRTHQYPVWKNIRYTSPLYHTAKDYHSRVNCNKNPAMAVPSLLPTLQPSQSATFNLIFSSLVFLIQLEQLRQQSKQQLSILQQVVPNRHV